jgi:glycosyltransferase involved in cell wall biosynthesis
MSLSVICPTYRNPKCLDIFLKSAVENRTNALTEIIVIVDGFAVESQHLIDLYGKLYYVKFIVLPENKGMQHAINVGVMQAKSEKIFVVNDDNVFGADYDRILIDIYDPQTVITVNQVERTAGMFNFVVNDLGDPDTFDYEAFLAFEPTIRKDVVTPNGNIFPFLINKRWFMVVNGFDTFYDSPNVCDMDFFLKLELCGFTFARAHHLHLYHFGSVATKKNADKSTFTAKEAAAFDTFYYKWGYTPGYGQANSKLPQTDFVRGVQFR